MRNSLTSITALAAALFLLGGCNRAESPGEVAQDTQEAQQEGQQDVAQAEQDAAQRPDGRQPGHAGRRESG